MGGTIREVLSLCSLPAAPEGVGDRGSFMDLRAALPGVHHFQALQSEPGLTRNLLANRLARGLEHGILTRGAMPADRRKIEYRLTGNGAALLPTMIALWQWGERWETGMPATPVLVDARDMRPIGPIEVRAWDGRVLTKQDLLWALAEDVVHEPEMRAAE